MSEIVHLLSRCASETPCHQGYHDSSLLYDPVRLSQTKE